MVINLLVSEFDHDFGTELWKEKKEKLGLTLSKFKNGAICLQIGYTTVMIDKRELVMSLDLIQNAKKEDSDKFIQFYKEKTKGEK